MRLPKVLSIALLKVVQDFRWYFDLTPLYTCFWVCAWNIRNLYASEALSCPRVLKDAEFRKQAIDIFCFANATKSFSRAVIRYEN